MNGLDWLAGILVIVGALNWGLVGLFNYNLVDGIFGVESVLARIVYTLVGVAGIWMIFTLSRKSSV